MVDEGYGGFGGACDLVVAALEIDGVVVVDAALLAKGKMEVEQGRSGCRAEALGAGQEGDDAALEGAEAAFDFALCLRGGCDEVRDAECSEGALEFALWVAAVTAGAWAEEAEGVGVDSFGDAMFFKGGAERAEVVPGGVGGDETACDVEAGMVIHGEK